MQFGITAIFRLAAGINVTHLALARVKHQLFNLFVLGIPLRYSLVLLVLRGRVLLVRGEIAHGHGSMRILTIGGRRLIVRGAIAQTFVFVLRLMRPPLRPASRASALLA